MSFKCFIFIINEFFILLLIYYSILGDFYLSFLFILLFQEFYLMFWILDWEVICIYFLLVIFYIFLLLLFYVLIQFNLFILIINEGSVEFFIAIILFEFLLFCIYY